MQIQMVLDSPISEAHKYERMELLQKMFRSHRDGDRLFHIAVRQIKYEKERLLQDGREATS